MIVSSVSSPCGWGISTCCFSPVIKIRFEPTILNETIPDRFHHSVPCQKIVINKVRTLLQTTNQNVQLCIWTYANEHFMGQNL